MLQKHKELTKQDALNIFQITLHHLAERIG